MVPSTVDYRVIPLSVHSCLVLSPYSDVLQLLRDASIAIPRKIRVAAAMCVIGGTRLSMRCRIRVALDARMATICALVRRFGVEREFFCGLWSGMSR